MGSRSFGLGPRTTFGGLTNIYLIGGLHLLVQAIVVSAHSSPAWTPVGNGPGAGILKPATELFKSPDRRMPEVDRLGGP